MTYARVWFVCAAVAALGGGCGSSAGKTDGGSTDVPIDGVGPAGSGGAGGGMAGAGGTAGASGAAGKGGAGGTTGGAAGRGGTGVDAGSDAATPADCFPECVAALRRTCERPPYGTGSCSVGMSGPDTVYCYSNGVREIHPTIVDAGTSVTFTRTDGQTVCYRVVVSGSNQSFRNPAGAEVAQAMLVSGSVYSVTCAGSSTAVTVDIADPTCRTLNSSDCMPGTCP